MYLNGAGDNEVLEVDSAGGGSVSRLEYGRWQRGSLSGVGRVTGRLLEWTWAGGCRIFGIEHGRWQKKLYNGVGGREIFRVGL
jgi:hypothetical protein